MMMMRRVDKHCEPPVVIDRAARDVWRYLSVFCASAQVETDDKPALDFSFSLNDRVTRVLLSIGNNKSQNNSVRRRSLDPNTPERLSPLNNGIAKTDISGACILLREVPPLIQNSKARVCDGTPKKL